MNRNNILFPLPALMMAASFLIGVQTAPAQEKDTKPMLRLLCASGPVTAEQALLASKKENGQWNRLAATALRASMVSEWLPALDGELHILLKQNGKPASVSQFTYPAGASRALLILTADKDAKNYRSVVLDPEKEGFAAGTTVIINASDITGTVTLGTEILTVEAGKHLVAKPAPDENGGYSLLVHCPGKQGEKQLCYDRRAIHNPNSRNIIVLVPDPTVAMQVVSLSEFGPFK